MPTTSDRADAVQRALLATGRSRLYAVTVHRLDKGVYRLTAHDALL
jgi:hypothetical protein